MTNKKDEDSFNGMMEDFSEPQCDEQEDLPTDPEPDRSDYKGRQHMFQKEWMDWNDRIYPPEPPSARYVAMDESMVKPYKNAVHSPSHYDIIDTTVEKMIEKQFTHEELMGWFKGNIMKYRLRAFKKGDNGVQDINKADKYQGFYDEYVKRNTPK